MNLTFGQSPLFLLLLLSIAGAGAWWTYRTTIPEIDPLKRFFLGSLRFVSLAIILFLLFEPLLQKQTARTEEPVVAVLFDSSESMALADSLLGAPRSGSMDLMEAIRAETTGFNTRFYTFADNLSIIDSLDTVTLSGSRTNIASALSDAASQLADDNLSALILVSDGLYNAGSNPLHLAEQFPVPLMTVAHGDTSAQRDVRIADVITNELTYAGSIVPVQVRVRNEGITPSPLVLSLMEGSRVISTERLTLPRSGTEVVVDLEFEARDPGRREFRVALTRYENEATWRNNDHRFSVQVLDQKKSILLVAGAPSPDVSALSRLIHEDDTAELTMFVQSRRGAFIEGELPTDLGSYDLILSIGFPGPATIPADARRIAEQIASGTPFLFVLDHETSLARLDSEFGALLPVTLESSRDSFVPGSMNQMPGATSHAIFDIADRQDASLWRRLPPLYVSESTWSTAPGATELASVEIRGIALPDPLFAVMRRGPVKSAALLANGFWRWTLVPEDLEFEADRFKTMFANLIQWLYASDDDRLVRVYPAEREFAEGESVNLRGEVYDESLRPISDASLSLQVTSPEGQIFPFEMLARGNGRYGLDIGTLPSGAYEYRAAASRDDAILGKDTGSFSIGKRAIEFRQTRADGNLMSGLASRSGGVAFVSSNVNGMNEAIRALPSYLPVTTTSMEQIRLWQLMPLLFFMLFLLTIEWFFRKRFGMV